VIASDMIMLDSRRDQPELHAGHHEPAPVAATAQSQIQPVAPQPAKPSGPRAARVAALPRGKSSFEEEDLPF
jgi:hypothetical protein